MKDPRQSFVRALRRRRYRLVKQAPGSDSACVIYARTLTTGARVEVQLWQDGRHRAHCLKPYRGGMIQTPPTPFQTLAWMKYVLEGEERRYKPRKKANRKTVK